MVDNSWRDRERHRISSGEYSKPIWIQDANLFRDVNTAIDKKAVHTTEIRYHFAHVSVKNPAMIAYTENDTKGQADRQTPIKVGRYLNRFSEGLCEDRVREVVEAHNACFDFGEMEVATTPEDIVSVYTNGPNSCMSHSVSEFSSHIHPTHVYGAGDLGVAYIGGLAKPRARVLVHLKTKVYSTIYGDSARLQAVLQKSGYKPDEGCDGFEGSKVLKIQAKHHEDRWVMPYFDNDYGASYSKCGEYFVMSHECNHSSAQCTNGLDDDVGWCCNYCEDWQNEGDEEYYGEDVGTICYRCYEEHYFYCECCDETRHNEDSVIMNYYRWVNTDKRKPNGEGFIQERVQADITYCRSCADDHYLCEPCNDWYIEAELSETDEEYRCEKCHEEHLTETKEETKEGDE